jgi:hypothetical protein
MEVRDFIIPSCGKEMKLRLSENALRLRLENAELNDFAVLGRIEETVIFGPGTTGLRFALESSDVTEITATFEERLVTIQLPRAAVRNWMDSGEVGLTAKQATGGPPLEITVEKDLGRRTQMKTARNGGRTEKEPGRNRYGSGSRG